MTSEAPEQNVVARSAVVQDGPQVGAAVPVDATSVVAPPVVAVTGVMSGEARTAPSGAG